MTPNVPTQQLAALKARAAEGEPPPLVLQWWRELPLWLRTALQVIGLVMFVFFMLFPFIVEGVFGRDLWIGLWLANYGLAVPLSMLAMLGPPIGFKMLELLPRTVSGLLTKAIPKKLMKRPERRKRGDGE